MSDVTITEFLLARIGEDEYEANVMMRRYREGGNVTSRRWRRVLVECEAKRRIVELLTPYDDMQVRRQTRTIAGDTLRLLTLPFVDHPDYDPSWRI